MNSQPRHPYKQTRQGGNAQQGQGQRQGDASQQRRDEPRRVLVFRRETQADFGDFAR